ncbi:MAG: hypothetical protein Q9159_004366 [Coniocarpon cinnabarinum]
MAATAQSIRSDFLPKTQELSHMLYDTHVAPEISLDTKPASPSETLQLSALILSCWGQAWIHEYEQYLNASHQASREVSILEQRFDEAQGILDRLNKIGIEAPVPLDGSPTKSVHHDADSHFFKPDVQVNSENRRRVVVHTAEELDSILERVVVDLQTLSDQMPPPARYLFLAFEKAVSEIKDKNDTNRLNELNDLIFVEKELQEVLKGRALKANQNNSGHRYLNFLFHKSRVTQGDVVHPDWKGEELPRGGQHHYENFNFIDSTGTAGDVYTSRDHRF